MNLFKNKNFIYYIIITFLTITAKQIELVSLLWFLHSEFKNALLLGYLGLIQSIPILLFSFPSGYFSDIFSRKKILITGMSLIFSGTYGIVIAIFLKSSITLIFLFFFIGVIGRTLFNPARQSMLPLLVELENFSSAAAITSIAFQLGIFIGPAIGGFISSIHSIYSIYLSLILEGIVIYLLICLKVSKKQDDIFNGFKKEKFQHFLKSHKEAIQFILKNEYILPAISLDLLVVFFSGFTYLLPIYSDLIFNKGATGQGLFRTFEAFGAIVMALIISRYPIQKNMGKILFLSMGLFASGTIFFGLSQNFYLSLITIFFIGFLDNISVVIRHTIVQLTTPDYLRGRISGINSIFISLSNDLGGFKSGFLTSIISRMEILYILSILTEANKNYRSAQIATILGGITGIIIIIFYYFKFDSLKNLQNYHELKK